MGGGSVDTSTGEFNFAVNEAYIIRNGKICEPVKGATLIGKGNEVLMTLSVAAEDMGMIIGKRGKIAKAIRTVMRTISKIDDRKVTVEIK